MTDGFITQFLLELTKGNKILNDAKINLSN